MDFKWVTLAVVFAIILNVVVSEITVKKNCNNKDFKSYVHCIQKREANYWCSLEGCSLCVGKNCPLTCKGACGSCPSGNCCDGHNCNACYNNHCCSTPGCNYCIHSCAHACGNIAACQNACVPQCQNGTNEVFIVPTNIPTPNAVVYVKGKPYKGNIPEGQLSSPNKTTVTAVINGTEYPATVLDLRLPKPQPDCQNGRCNNTSCPGTLCGQSCSRCYKTCNNAGCQNRCSNNCIQQPPPQRLSQNVYNLPQGCCHVVHPPKCVTNQIYPYRHCYRRSHTECSNLCTSKFVHLVPQQQQKPQCHYIRNYPYIYCGHNSIQNCDSCYVCNGQYNPHQCVNQGTCQNNCRTGFYPPNAAVQGYHMQNTRFHNANHIIYPAMQQNQYYPGLS